MVLGDGRRTARIEDLRPGLDAVMTHTGTAAKVARIYAYDASEVECVRLLERFWITPEHPVFHEGCWVRPAELAPAVGYPSHRVKRVFNLELHGHADTVLCVHDGQQPLPLREQRPVIVSTLGKYCGEEYGFNIFTRKTVRCPGACAQCDSVYMPSAPFARGPTVREVEMRFKPFKEDPKEQLPPPF